MKRPLLFASFLTGSLGLLGQVPKTQLSDVLAAVERNNLELAAARARGSSQRLEARTGLNPPDPHASYDLLNGSPAEAGVQTEFSLFQSFDFPTAYGARRRLADLREAQADLHVVAVRRRVLLATKLLCISLVHLRQRVTVLSQRLEGAEVLEAAAAGKYGSGEGNALDANRARLFALAARTELRNAQLELEAEERHLVEYNGNHPIQFTDTIYPVLPAMLEPIEQLEPIIEAADPIDGQLQQQVGISEHALSLSRALALPELEAGYRYQALLGQEFNGFHAGINLPLWEHHNTVKHRELEIAVAQADLMAHRNEHRQEVLHLHARASAALQSLGEYREALRALPDGSLLDKALLSGELSVVQHQLERTNYFAAQDRLLDLEREAQRAVAELYAHEL